MQSIPALQVRAEPKPVMEKEFHWVVLWPYSLEILNDEATGANNWRSPTGLTLNDPRQLLHFPPDLSPTCSLS